MTRTRIVSVLAATLLVAACGEAPAEKSPMTFTNPVHDRNFPDPGVLRVDGTFYAYGTNSAVANVPLLTSTDLVHWTERGDVLPAVGEWADPGNTWAPEVLRTDAGTFVLYYTARWNKADRQCIGTAVADSPTGPFLDTSGEPLICQDDEGGSIDASPFRDEDGSLYLYWKNDGNHIGVPSHLYAQRLDRDGRKLTGDRVRLLTNNQPWHGPVVEAPEMLRHDGKLYLFYSGGAFDQDGYAVGYATCDSPLGPCHDAAENPILRSAGKAAGPGHCYPVTLADGTVWLLYHAWPADAIGSISPGRQMWLDRVDWVGGKPVVHGPTADPQPMPGTANPQKGG
ncbi:glycoside hydrolase family 43 protein [Paractinoplanes ferrugineus]|uniref:Glycoside hydrolase n=1 Tax=Paractinoplanes ferrugineus TaxID=113564 RepID=A0A919MHH9_9ACTN|nr:glycoside hydrolase family 43 protein [Actinoplanes ferrugineus]GIE14974.1 glycoside hydrolase [Actinoplanes ferrugineus]